LAKNVVRKPDSLQTITDVFCPVQGEGQADSTQPQDQLTVAKLRMGDLEKRERQRAESLKAVGDGKMTFGDALAVFKPRLANNPEIKPHTKEYYGYRITALFVREVTLVDATLVQAARRAPAKRSPVGGDPDADYTVKAVNRTTATSSTWRLTANTRSSSGRRT
jgi:hypothetical protein